MAARFGNRRIRARNVTLLPEPDSPSSASTSPGARVRSTPPTARTGGGPENSTVSPFTSTIASLMRAPLGRDRAGMAGRRIRQVAGDAMRRLGAEIGAEAGLARRAHRSRELAAGVEAAAGWRIDRIG